MATMTKALEALEALEVIAVRSDHQPPGSEIMDVIGEGVSRELCKSIQSVISLPEVDQMDLDFSWARAVAPPRNAVKRVLFPKESAPIVEQIAERLRKVPRESGSTSCMALSQTFTMMRMRMLRAVGWVWRHLWRGERE